MPRRIVLPDPPLSRCEVTAALESLPGWLYSKHRLAKTYEFPTFRAAIGFMLRVSVIADDMNHHPDWSNAYTTVRIQLTTHHSGNRVTAKDVALAQKMERVFHGAEQGR